jgi:hypothetical protein
MFILSMDSGKSESQALTVQTYMERRDAVGLVRLVAVAEGFYGHKDSFLGWLALPWLKE